jgi:hypothetical protein
MAEIVALPLTATCRIRLEAARIHRLRRPITQSNAIRDLDRQIIREATGQGMRRGEALTFADAVMDAVAARLMELERQRGELIITRNVLHLRRAGAAA